ncbi:N-formylglutamate amidohydrolase [Aliidongia dinghuensis]|uniref:N-formylglutamate amidohydrolase n=1 Tax=Aliidongia dinghuensis TaxID=1867774 RepID=A0A8J2YP89_9PROT|nr:N-formylglutamate amidohydrolase [Aliidongia dinghuensis]GGF02070.1 N-formylglutamate amidohydrolase [Aliidongia dinghuensis]
MHGTAPAPPAVAAVPPVAVQPYEILPPTAPRRALVVASPHSGDHYPDEFLAASRLDALTLRKSEDCFVDEICAAAPSLGAPLLCALFPRAFVDCNREPWELDPQMFEDALPDFVNCQSPRVAVGLGTIARLVADGEAIYRRKLRFAEAATRIESCYHPYHAALAGLVDETVAEFGCCILVDAHSMPSIGVGPGATRTRRRVDMVLGDRMGSACHPLVIEIAERVLRGRGYQVVRNTPYAGGFTTRHYGRPDEGRHALQIELNRALYMDERSLARKPFLATLRDDIGAVFQALAAIEPDALT